ncbi:MAG: ATPase, T2SS/T4P/T4SS family, partial [Desulfuromonadaceae bacterium]|nr:ATPase, T2SS/T4P/T4SS family [Desulfuromonadaceae bacterium]
MIAELLQKEHVITEEQLAYAVRIHSKLSSPLTLIDTLLDLGYLTRDALKNCLRNNRINIRLGDFLIELGYISNSDLAQALGIQGQLKVPKRLGEILVERGFIEERKFLEALSYQLGFPIMNDISYVQIDRSLLSKIPLAVCQQCEIVPVRYENSNVLIALVDPLDQKALESSHKYFGEKVRFVISTKDSIRNTLLALEQSAVQPKVMEENTVISIINNLLDDALNEGASDIHIEPQKDRLRVRFRIDGVMQQHKEFSKELSPQILSRVKIMAKSDIAEKRRHQDGRILYNSILHGMDIDLRVSIFVTIYGETIVMRLLTNKSSLLDIKELGMEANLIQSFIDVIEAPSGIMIFTGPTGAGKTSTLYSCVQHLNNINTSIITAEDPVEILIDGVSQCSINAKLGVSYEETLRHIVRQDPDIIVLGEIRDQFSADTAIQSAMTGHKVLTTFHTEDSVGGLLRLMNMEIEPFLISSTVACIVAQRLLRRVCPKCSERYIPTSIDLNRLNITPGEYSGAEFKTGRGCSDCRFSGYKGRVGVFELLTLSPMVKDAIVTRKNSSEIRRSCIESSGMVTLLENGLVKAASGEITLKEIIADLARFGKIGRAS